VKDFDYAKEFAKLDLNAVKADIRQGPDGLAGLVARRLRQLTGRFFIRMAWHSAATYGTIDLAGRFGRGRCGSTRSPAGRTTPTSTRPSACLADQAEVRQERCPGRLDGPHRQRVARIDGFKTFGFAGGRADDWEPDWLLGPSRSFLADERYSGDRH